MAGREVGIRLSVTDADIVKTALTQIGTAGEGALKRIEAASGGASGSLGVLGVSVDRLQKSLDADYRSQANLQKVTETLTVARAAGLVDAQREADLLGLAQQKYGVLTPAINDNEKAVTRHTGALGLNAIQMAESGHVVRSLVGALSAGIPVEQAFAFEGNRIVSIFANGEGGIGGSLSKLGGLALDLLTPMNLVIAAVAALEVGAALWLTSEHDKTTVATTSLQDHKKWLDQILDGYDKAKTAADNYLTSAEKLPEAAAASNLAKQQQERQQEFAASLKAIQDQASQYAQTIAKLHEVTSVPTLPGVTATSGGPAQQTIDQFDRVRQIIAQVGNVSAMSKTQIDQMVVELTAVANSAADTRLASIASSALDLVMQARNAKIEVQSTDDALRHLPSSITVQIDLQMQNFDAARKKLLDLMPDTRDRWTKARDDAGAAYNQEIGAAPDAIMRQAAAADYQKVLAGIDAAEKAAAAKHPAAAPKVAPYTEVTNALNLQLKALTATDRQKEIDAELSKAKVSASSTEGKAITALAGKYYDQKQAIDAVNSAESFLSQNFEQGIDGIITGTESASDAIGNLEKAIVSAALQAELLGSGPLAGILGTAPTTAGQTGGALGWLASFLHPNALGGAYASPALGAFRNTIVSKPTLFPFANGIGLMGETGDPGEAIMPLIRNAQGKLGVAAVGQGGGGDLKVDVQIVHQPGAADGATVKRNGQNLSVQAIVGDAGAKNLATPGAPMNRTMRTMFGARQQLTRR